MILTAHLLTGAVLATRIKFLPLSLLFAFLSHYVLDFLPHQEYSIKNIFEKRWRKSFFDFFKVALDISFGVLIILILSKNQPLALIGGFFAILADGLTLLFLIFPKDKFLERHYNLHQNRIHFVEKKKVSQFWGILSQVIIIFIAIFFL